MRRLVLISGIVAGAIVLVAAALTVYAYFNLSSILASNESRILARVSDGLGRHVEVGKIQAQMGWGVSVEISGLTIADDPAFSAKPFLAASEVSADVEFIPLLGGRARVSKLHLVKPDFRIIMNPNGDLNINSLGSNPNEAAKAPSTHAHKRSSLGELSITALDIEDGEVSFSDRTEKASPIRVNHLDLDVTNFNAAAAFDVEAKFAFPGDTQNVEASGKLGPLLNQGVLDGQAIPVDVKMKLDSILLDTLRPLADIGSNIPPALSITNAADVTGNLGGTIGTLTIAATTDLTANRVVYAPILDKPAGTAMTVNANATWGNHLAITSASAKLSDLELTTSKFSGGGAQPLSMQIDSNSFNLANLSPMISGASRYGLAGMGEVHGILKVGGGNAPMAGTVTLKQVAAKLPSWSGGVSDLNGTVQIADGIEVVEPTSFTFGSAHANLEGRVESISPLKASYALKADSVKLA
ncbi:MAG: AsmA family protein, partial [Candidatus Binatus sp.]